MTNPVEVAYPIANTFVMDNILDDDAGGDERLLLSVAERMAADKNLFGKNYWVDAGRGIITAATLDTEEVSCSDVFSLKFRGEFCSYSAIRMRSIGKEGVRAFCLTFSNAYLALPFTRIEEDDFLHVPLFAVQNINQVT